MNSVFMYDANIVDRYQDKFREPLHTSVTRFAKLKTSPTKPRIIAVGGGKGGVGKTVVSALIGICLANMNKRTVIVDADFSGPNLHTCLNTFNAKVTFRDFVQSHERNINRLMLKTGFENLSIVSGAPGVLGTGNFSYWQKKKIIRNLRKLDADYVILDLAAGTGFNELDMWLAADDCIIVCQTDPLSVQDAYGFARASLLRKLQRTFHNWPEFITVLNECGNLDKGYRIRTLNSVLDDVPDFDRTWRRLIDGIVKSFRPNLVLNMIRDNEDTRQIQALRLSLQKILGVNADLWGGIRFDVIIRTALMQMRPDMMLSPSGRASADIVRIVSRNIIAKEIMAPQLGHYQTQSDDNSYQDETENVRICNYRCVAWNCCDKRQGGLPCTKITAQPVRMAV